MATVSVSTTLSASHPLGASDLAHACGAHIDWVVQLVEVGIVEVRAPHQQPEEWCFQSSDLQAALEARRLERAFGVELEAAALIIELQREVRRLKALLQARGLQL